MGGSRIRKEGINTKHLFKETETVGPKWNWNVVTGTCNTVQQDRKVQLLLKSVSVSTRYAKTDFSKR